MAEVQRVATSCCIGRIHQKKIPITFFSTYGGNTCVPVLKEGRPCVCSCDLDFWSWRLLNWIQSVSSNHSHFWREKRHVLRLSSKPSVSSVTKNQSFSFKLKDLLTQTLLVIFIYLFILTDSPPSGWLSARTYVWFSKKMQIIRRF